MNQVSPSKLPLIRIALLTGALAFGGIVWFQQREAGWAPDPRFDRTAFMIVIRVEWAIALVATLVLFLRTRRVRDPQMLATLGTIAWAIGEGTALLGGTYYFQSGDSSWYGLGVSFLVLTLIAFPGRPRT